MSFGSCALLRERLGLIGLWLEAVALRAGLLDCFIVVVGCYMVLIRYRWFGG